MNRPSKTGPGVRPVAATIVIASFFCLFSLLLFAAPAHAIRSLLNYPKVMTYTSGINELPESVQDTLSWYDLLVCMDRPESIAGIRARNPDVRFLWQTMPQFALPPEGPNPWWLPDTTWNFNRLLIWYAEKNDWYLRDTSGQIINFWGHRVLNWTRYCPTGTYGTARGLRAAEWIARVGLPKVSLDGAPGGRWDWDEFDTYNGFMLEILADCFGSYSVTAFANADPNRDGVAEGVTKTCSMGGADEPLSVLMREENEVFYQIIQQTFPPDFVINVNENNRFIGPWWSTKMSGMKLENWTRPGNPPWHDWWDWFYGLTPPWIPGDNWGAGYDWIESAFDRPCADRLHGWDTSYLVVWDEDRYPEQQNLQRMRWGLGTTLLGDGYFCYTRDQRYPDWQPEFDWDFGEPLDDYHVDLHGSDSLYYRIFENGLIEVNPYTYDVFGVPAKDSRFSFWVPVEDLRLTATGPDRLEATWTTPHGEHNDGDFFELRYSRNPITIDNWEQATSYSGNPIVAVPGSPVSATLYGLQGGAGYYAAIRTTTRGHAEPVLSNVAFASTQGGVDQYAPGMIGDLRKRTGGTNWIELIWTATGDDGGYGTAARYRMRYLVERPIESEADWQEATVVSGLPAPAVAGTPQSFRVYGLYPSTTYSIAIRAEDEGGNLGELHPPVLVRTEDPTPPPEDTVPPAAIVDLAGGSEGPGAIRIAWSAPGDDGWNGRATDYVVRFLQGETITNQTQWQNATIANDTPPVPGAPHDAQSMVLTGLKPGSFYGVAVRARDEAHNMGGLSNPLMLRAGVDDPPPPIDQTSPGAIDDLEATEEGPTFLQLQWKATGDDGEVGTATSYELRILDGRVIRNQADWDAAEEPAGLSLPAPALAGTIQGVRVDGLTPSHFYGVALRAVDEAGNMGALNPPLGLQTSDPPDALPPEPIADLAAIDADTASILLRWTAPADAPAGGASAYRMRIADGAVADDAVWESGTEIEGLPEPLAPGAEQEFRSRGLAPDHEYAFVLRSLDEAENLSAVSNVARGRTAKLPVILPPAPPAPIADLHVTSVGSDSAALAWTAPGDDGDRGRASLYRVRLRVGGTIETESQWLAASEPDTAGLGVPLPAGSAEVWTVRGLEPGTIYGIAIRAEDDSLLLGGLSAPLSFETAPPLPDPPAAITDLEADSIGVDACRLVWTAVDGDGNGGAARSYLLARREGSDPIDSEDEWEAADPTSEGLPWPGMPGALESVRLTGLAPSTDYAVALRAAGEDGRLGPLGPGVLLRTEAEPEVPDPPPAPILDLAAEAIGTSWASLVWTAVGEDSLTGAAGSYEVRILVGEPLATEADWSRASTFPVEIPAAPAGDTIRVAVEPLSAETRYGIAVRARDAAGQISLFVPGLLVTTEAAPPLAPPPVENLQVAEVHAKEVVLSWTHPLDAGDPAGPGSYEIAIARQPFDESGWDALEKHPSPPEPGEGGAEILVRWDGLSPLTDYWFSVRAVGLGGVHSAMSELAHATTDPLDLSPPEPPSSLRIVSIDGDRVELSWLPSPAPDVAGYQIYEESGAGWEALLDEPLPAEESSAVVVSLASSFAITAIDAAGNEGRPSEPALRAAEAFSLEGPFPHPVGDECRFRLDVPLDLDGVRCVLWIEDIDGREIRRLLDRAVPAGAIDVAWDRTDASGSRAAPGFYRVIVEAGTRRVQRRIFLAP